VDRRATGDCRPATATVDWGDERRRVSLSENGNPEVVRVEARRAGKLTCEGTRRDGAPCGATPTAASSHRYCFFHSPDVPSEQKSAAVRLGGFLSRPGALSSDTPDPELKTPEQITGVLERVSGAVLRGELGGNVGRVVVDSCRAALQAYDSNLAQRIADLEVLVASRQRKPTAIVVRELKESS